MIQQLSELPQIYLVQVNLPENPLKVLNSYVIHVDKEWLVIDTGFNRPECRMALLDGLREVGIDWEHTSLFLTHLHSDHIGLVHEFSDRGCTVYMNAIDHQIVVQPHDLRWGGLECTFRQEGFPQEMIDRQDRENQGRAYAPKVPFPITEIGHQTKLKIGSLEAVCLHTPGHTPGHTVLYLPEEQILFSGDHILFHITPNISIWDGVPHSLEDYLNSLSTLRKLPVKRTFPAHRTWEGNLYQRLEELERHHMARLEELYSIVCKHPGQTAYTLAGRLTWSARGQGWDAFPPHQKWFAMGETLAHLYYLRDRSTVERRTEQDQILYYPAR